MHLGRYRYQRVNCAKKMNFVYLRQVLYSLKWDDDEEESDRGRQPSTNFVETMSKRAFTEIFGDTERSEINNLQ